MEEEFKYLENQTKKIYRNTYGNSQTHFYESVEMLILTLCAIGKTLDSIEISLKNERSNNE